MHSGFCGLFGNQDEQGDVSECLVQAKVIDKRFSSLRMERTVMIVEYDEQGDTVCIAKRR